MKKSLKFLSVAVLVIAIGGSYFFPQIKQYVGAVPSADISSSYLSVNGLVHEYRRTKLTTATTTPCAFKSPAATSTLVYASAMVNVASSTATTWTVAKAASAFATTTYLDVFSLGSGVQGTMVSSATTTGVDIKQTLAPNTYVVWGMAGVGTTYDATKLAGVCSAEFIVSS